MVVRWTHLSLYYRIFWQLCQVLLQDFFCRAISSAEKIDFSRRRGNVRIFIFSKVSLGGICDITITGIWSMITLFLLSRFIRSLSRCKVWEAKGGKSGSAFCKTHGELFDSNELPNIMPYAVCFYIYLMIYMYVFWFPDNRFILKQMSSTEVEIFEKFGFEYFQYISKCYMEQV